MTTLASTSPLLTRAHLHDPDRFEAKWDIPVLDAHEDSWRGDVDEALLHRIARNTNARVARGDFPALILGHTRPKYSKEIEHDGRKVRILGADEEGQPPIVGYATDFHVGEHKGRPCILCTYHIYSDRAREIYERFPFRSVERVSPDEYIDRISLLATPPERDLGVLTYEQDSSRHTRIYYSRGFPPIEAESGPESGATTTGPGSDRGGDDMADEKKENDLGLDYEKLGEAMVMKFEGVLKAAMDKLPEAFRNILNEAIEPPTAEGSEGEAVKYAEDEEPEEHAEPDGDECPAAGGGKVMAENGKGERKPYADASAAPAEAEAGGTNTYMPGYEDQDEPVRRTRYEKDLTDTSDAVVSLANRVMALEDLLNKQQFENRRLKYGQILDKIAEEREINKAEELAELLPDSPSDFEEKRAKKMRTHYARRIATRNGSGMLVAVADPPSPAGTGGPVTERESVEAIGIVTRSGGTVKFSEALAQVRGK